MLPLNKLSSSFVREATAITILYLTTLMDGCAQGFSAVAIPDIKNEMDTSNGTYLIPSIVASSKDLTWFGNKNRNVKVKHLKHISLDSKSF